MFGGCFGAAGVTSRQDPRSYDCHNSIPAGQRPLSSVSVEVMRRRYDALSILNTPSTRIRSPSSTSSAHSAHWVSLGRGIRETGEAKEWTVRRVSRAGIS